MLTITKQITLNGESRINGVAAEGYRAEINTRNPEDMTISSWQLDKTAYRDGKTTRRQDRADFEDAAYELQEELMASIGNEEVE